MPAPRIPRSPLVHNRTPREGMDANHLANVRQLVCLVCGSGPPNHAHHLLRSGEHAMGRKSSDRWAISLCDRHHRELHAAGDEDAYLMQHGIDGRAVATVQWTKRGNLPAMARIVFRARQEAARKKERAA